ncbi:MAG: sulfite exporter TauE/SafE family protein [Syntrophomonas sp.]
MEKIVRKTLEIKNMTCSSCEMRIENTLKKMPGIINVRAEFSYSNVNVTYNENVIKINEIIAAIENVGYQVINKQGNQSAKAKDDKFSLNQLLGIGIIIFAFYVIVNNTVGFNFIPQIDKNAGYGILFIIGLITSLHCMAMCGGINLSQCVSYKIDPDNLTRLSKFKPSLMYNAGRVVSYTLIGGIVGALGSAVSFSGTAKGTVAIISGVLMVIMGLNMLNMFPWLRRFNPRMPRIFGSRILNNNGKHGPFYIGLLNGLMPCGPLQAMQIYALGTGSFLAGALSMFMFSLGTVPLMFGFGAISFFLSSKFTHRMMKASAVLVMVLGIIMVSRGLSLSGVAYANPSAAASVGSGNVAKIEGNVQVVSTTLDGGRYSPIIVQKGIPVKWTIKANSQDINGCNETMVIPKYNVEKQLVSGDNIIEFTPDQSGSIPYTCWMGMISSNIQVVADINKVSKNDINKYSNSTGSAAGAGMPCCQQGYQP